MLNIVFFYVQIYYVFNDILIIFINFEFGDIKRKNDKKT